MGLFLGPFDLKPIELRATQFMIRDKLDSDTRRTIVKRRWPKGQSVNSGAKYIFFLAS